MVLTLTPKAITYHANERTLKLEYAETHEATLTAEYLRVFSPSAEVRGHSEAQRVLQTGKKQVGIDKIEAVGNYAIRLTFSDGHDTGIYSWEYLRDLIDNETQYWQDYLRDLASANASRLPTIPIGQWTPKTTK